MVIILSRALGFDVERQKRKCDVTWKRLEKCKKFDLRKEDVLCLSRWIVGNNQIAGLDGACMNA